MMFTLVIVLVASAMSPVTSFPATSKSLATPEWLADFEAGDPLTEEELQSDFSSLSRELGNDEFIPWDKQHPELLEGDIMPSGSKNAILNSLWPNKIIPYVIASSYTTDQRKIIAFAMATYHNKTCIRFVPRTTQTNYISIFKSGKGCWSYVGVINTGAQGVSLDDGCVSTSAPGVVLHELMHTAGFWHEHMRPDRDTYVSINLKNVAEAYRGNFYKLSTTQVTTLGLKYDYGSVMHYPKAAFAIDRTVPVITALIGTPVLGQRKGFSSLDVQKLNKLYKCPSCGSG